MPLTKIQVDVLRLLASHRNAESYVAGATPLTAMRLVIPPISMFFMIGRSGLQQQL